MLENFLIALLVLAFILVWWFIGRYPELLIRCVNFFPLFKKGVEERMKNYVEYQLHVYSAETANGQEAEYLDETLPKKNKIVRLFRVILIGMCSLILAYLVFIRGCSGGP